MSRLSMTRSALVAASLAVMTAGPVLAQSRSGFWMDFGIGHGGLRLTCVACNAAKYGGHTATLSIGGSTERNVLLGLEGQVWTGDRGPKQSVSTLTAVVQWYPTKPGGFFLRGGTGIVRGRVARSDSSAQEQTVRGSGVTLSFGAGYDVPIGRRFAVTVQVAEHVAALGDLKLPGITFKDTIAYVLRFSASITLR